MTNVITAHYQFSVWNGQVLTNPERISCNKPPDSNTLPEWFTVNALLFLQASVAMKQQSKIPFDDGNHFYTLRIFKSHTPPNSIPRRGVYQEYNFTPIADQPVTDSSQNSFNDWVRRFKDL